MTRRETNTGKFAHLPVPMQLKEVRRIAEKYDIDLTGLKIKIQRDVSLLRQEYSGSADPKHIGRIDFQMPLKARKKSQELCFMKRCILNNSNNRNIRTK
ncbi:MAG: hypothetical protein FWG65_12960 [Turicibacter sp.]|nr:hypothetical protein [Turicibacter sp.]